MDEDGLYLMNEDDVYEIPNFKPTAGPFQRISPDILTNTKPITFHLARTKTGEIDLVSDDGQWVLRQKFNNDSK